jgi:hypothetical protein
VRVVEENTWERRRDPRELVPSIKETNKQTTNGHTFVTLGICIYLF